MRRRRCSMRNARWWILLVSGLVILVGCHKNKVQETRTVTQEPAVVSAGPGDTYVQETTVVQDVPPVVDETIYVQEAPPEVIVENAPPSPGPDMYWVNGYWIYSNNQYQWYKGRYIATVPGQRFVPAPWEHTDQGWRFYKEQWTQ